MGGVLYNSIAQAMTELRKREGAEETKAYRYHVSLNILNHKERRKVKRKLTDILLFQQPSSEEIPPSNQGE
jgi:hypothetical protein